MNVQWTFSWLGVAALAAGLASAALYGHRRRWPDAMLALAAGVALAALLSEPARPAHGGRALAIASDVPGDALALALLAVPQAGTLALTGNGLTDAQWRDLPARPVHWEEPAGEVLSLDFARSVPLGRDFTLTVRRSRPAPGWKLQLLAENGQVLAEAAAVQPSEQLSVHWQPPLAEKIVLRARLLDVNGKAYAEGPVPLLVTEPIALQVAGRFGAPSFDTRILNTLLTDSGAIVEWQTTLGKGLSRTESARAALDHPNAHVIDAAWFEAASAPQRAALLAQVAQGVPLVILGGNAAAPPLWLRELALPLQPQSPATEKDDARVFGAGAQALSLPPAGFNPAPAASPWRVLASDTQGKPWLWRRGWKQGGIVWVGVAGWHRYAVTSPAALGAWWQTLFDTAVNGGAQDVLWEQPDPMPVAGTRTRVCAQGVNAGAPLRVQGWPDIAWQVRADRAEGWCAAFIPQREGWHALSSGVGRQDAQYFVYVYGERDWPQWRQGLRRQATRAYMARTRAAASARPASAPLPAWPFALAFAAAMLALWRRDLTRPADRHIVSTTN